MRKVNEVAQVIERRIANADHVLGGIPSERRMAEELGMSRTTVRSAIQRLVAQGVLVREANGRLGTAAQERSRATRVVGFVLPAGSSSDHQLWYEGVLGALEGQSIALRWITYAHLSDAAVAEAILNLDGLFLIPPSQKLPPWLVSRIKGARCRTVVLDQDETAAGLPSVGMFPPLAERILFDHLVKLGHRRIDCLVAQPGDDADTAPDGTHGRIAVWKNYLAEKGLTGQLRTLVLPTALESGYRLVREALQEGRPLASALFCTTGPTAIGAMRALHEAGLDIGRDVSVCAVNDEGLGRYQLKTLTALQSPPRARYLRKAVQWMLGEESWEGPLLIQPKSVLMYEGESTGPAPKSPVVARP